MGYTFRGLTFDEFEEGAVYTTASRTITEADVVSFAGLSGDFNPLHTDETFAQNTPFKTRIAHGALGLAVATGLANQLGIFEGTTLALMEIQTRFTGPVLFGDTIHMEMKVANKKETSKPDRGVISFETAVRNQKGEDVLQGQWTLMMRRQG
jgi:acyl dehydratase